MIHHLLKSTLVVVHCALIPVWIPNQHINNSDQPINLIFPNTHSCIQNRHLKAIFMLNKITYSAKKARPIRSSSYLTTSIYIVILATKNFDIKVRPRIS